jgi:DNA repair exonuclease SbcCD ATPase subunit/DNA repair exonuclease SbcCD nuclease subunit
MRIAHIADVHWRGYQRHKEYRNSFSDMFNQLKSLNVDAICLAGDIVHSKTQGISPELIDNLNWWFTELSRIAPTHIILGNHDGLILNKDRQDAISPILNALNLHNVHLYKKSGVYADPSDDRFNWCAFSPFDEEGYKSVKPQRGKINIAMYHGAVWGSHTDMDFMLDGDCKMDFFRGFEYVMLGDIHKRQQLDKEGRIWYPGSPIQQNYGESGEKGFLLWDIKSDSDFSVNFYPIKHTNPFVTVDWQGNIQATISKCMKDWPAGARFRIRSTVQLDPKTQRKLATVLRREHVADEVVYQLKLKQASISKETSEKIKIQDLSDPVTHKKLLREWSDDEGLTDPEFWSEVDRIVEETVPKLKVSADLKGNLWSIKEMNFDNTFAYGKDNVINFSKLSGIVGLFGRNRSGKSSIPGTIMYALYNSNDRGIASIQHIINTRRSNCSADVTFSVNGKLYRLERHSVRYPARGGKSEGAMSYLSLYEIDDEGRIIRDLSGEQRRDTEKSLRALIGTPEDFMMTSFAAQGNMNSFIKQGPTERKKTISNFMGLDVYDQFQSIVKEESAGVKSMLKRLSEKDWVALIRSSRTDITNFKERRTILSEKINDLNDRYREFSEKAQEESGGDFVDPSQLARKRKLLENKVSGLSDIKDYIGSLKKGLQEKDDELKILESLRDRFPLDSYNRRLELLEGLRKNLQKMHMNLKQEKVVMSNQKRSVALLKEVPCGDSFPSCKFIAESHANKKLLKEQKELVSNLKSELNEAKIKVEQLEEEGLRQKIQEYNENIRKIQDTKMAIVVSNSKLAKEKRDYNDTVVEISKLSDDITDMELRSDEEKSVVLANLKTKLKSIDREVKTHKADMFNLAQKIGERQANIKQLEKESIEFDRLQVEWKVYDYLLKATSWRGIPAYIMKKQLPIINNEMSKILQDSAGFTVELDITDRKTDIFINYGDSRRPIECASGMEKMVSSMALRVALGNVSNLNKSDMFIVDEGFGALDPQNLEAVTSLMKRLKAYYRLIMVISHVDVIKDSVDNIIDITKEGKESKVEYV